MSDDKRYPPGITFVTDRNWWSNDAENNDAARVAAPTASETNNSAERKGSNPMIVQAPERAVEHLKEARMYVTRIIHPASGDRRIRATQIANTITALIEALEALESERK